jgi:hypothetical protein
MQYLMTMFVIVSFKEEEYAALNLSRVTLGMLNLRVAGQQGTVVTAEIVGWDWHGERACFRTTGDSS